MLLNGGWNYGLKAIFDFSQFPQRRRDGQPRGADGREQAANQSNHRGPDHTAREQFRRDFERERNLAEALKVHRRGVKIVEGDVGQHAANDAANQRQQQRFNHERDDHRAAAKSKRPQRGDFARPRRDGAIHRVQRAEHRADGHQKRDEKTERRDQPRHGFGLLGIVIGLPGDLHGELRVGGEGILECLKRARRIQPDGDGLKGVTAIIRRLQHFRVGPDFRFRNAASGGKDADDRPFVAAHFDF